MWDKNKVTCGERQGTAVWRYNPYRVGRKRVQCARTQQSFLDQHCPVEALKAIIRCPRKKKSSFWGVRATGNKLPTAISTIDAASLIRGPRQKKRCHQNTFSCFLLRVQQCSSAHLDENKTTSRNKSRCPREESIATLVYCTYHHTNHNYFAVKPLRFAKHHYSRIYMRYGNR